MNALVSFFFTLVFYAFKYLTDSLSLDGGMLVCAYVVWWSLIYSLFQIMDMVSSYIYTRWFK
jgi:hypothetical protein